MKLFNFVPIAKEGLLFILILLVATLISFYFLKIGVTSIILLALTIFTISFFRNPDRATPTEPDAIIAPADGKVIFIGEFEDNRILKRKVKKISIFMSVFNVHVNRMPITGKIKNIVYNHGKFFNAAAPKASLDNEQNAIHVQREDGKELVFIQIAGLIARRIVCYLKIDQIYKVGQRMGLIKFGSRLDLYLPLETEIKVSLNDKTTAGKTIIGTLPLSKEQ